MFLCVKVIPVAKIKGLFPLPEGSGESLWQMKGKFIHIRYFALRDENATYKGTIEVSQDVTEIRGLEGEKRLL